MTGCIPGPKKEGSLRRPRLAVVSHNFIFHNLKVKYNITPKKRKCIQFRMRDAQKEGSLRRPKLAVLSHLFIFHYFNVD